MHDQLSDDLHPGQLAVLTVADVNDIGVFLDQGTDKDLLIPKSELHAPLRRGQRVVVMIQVDDGGRPFASSKLTQYLDFQTGRYQPGHKVSLLVYGSSARGWLCVVDGKHPGMLFADRTHEPVAVCDELQGYVTAVGPTGKLDLALRRPGVDPFQSDLVTVATRLKEDGQLPLHDKSTADEIKRELGMSKKSFKRVLGRLYKDRKIELLPDGVRWIGD